MPRRAIEFSADPARCVANRASATMPMHFIHRLDRLHMRLADSPQGEAGSSGGQPSPEAGIDPDNTGILAQSETQGIATAISSIYAVRYGSSEGDRRSPA